MHSRHNCLTKLVYIKPYLLRLILFDITLKLVLPIPLTVAWLITKAHEGDTDITSCGSGYSFLPSYWILEGPRLAVILVRNTLNYDTYYVISY